MGADRGMWHIWDFPPEEIHKNEIYGQHQFWCSNQKPLESKRQPTCTGVDRTSSSTMKIERTLQPGTQARCKCLPPLVFYSADADYDDQHDNRNSGGKFLFHSLRHGVCVMVAMLLGGTDVTTPPTETCWRRSRGGSCHLVLSVFLERNVGTNSYLPPLAAALKSVDGWPCRPLQALLGT
jgi:hypothetical protein